VTANEEKDRKANVIHTRVPDELDAEIKRRAQSLGVSVSNLVRNVLQHTFGLVGDIVADGAEIARSARGASTPASAPTAILGWQELVLNLNAVCDRCNAILAKGTAATVAVVDGPGPRPFRCRGCVEELGRDAG
jgi:hypothetical protein